MSTPRATAEVEPVSQLILHPLLQDPKFLAAAIVLVVSLILVSGQSLFSMSHLPLLKICTGYVSGTRADW